VKHFDDGFIGHQLQKRFEIDPIGQRIDDRFFFRRRELDEAELRPEGFSRRNSVSTATKGCRAARTQKVESASFSVMTFMLKA